MEDCTAPINPKLDNLAAVWSYWKEAVEPMLKIVNN